MKTTKILFLLLGLSVTLFAQKSPSFKVSPDLPKPGDRITLRYDAGDGPLKAADQVDGRLYIYDDYKWIIKDLSLQLADSNQWTTDVVLTDKASLITCVFFSDTIIDRGGIPTYSWIINNVPGGYAGWAFIRNQSLKNETPQVVDESAYISDTIALRLWINNEIRDHPQSRYKIFYEALVLLKNIRAEEPTERIKEEIRFILDQEDLDVKAQYDVQRTLDLLASKEQKFKDSVKEVLIKRYPEGVLARDNAILDMFKEADFEKKANKYDQFVKHFPSAKFEEVYTDMEMMYLEKVYKAIAYSYIVKQNDYSFIFDRYQTAPFGIVYDYCWHLVSIPLRNRSMSNDSLLLFADKLIPELEKRETTIPRLYKGKLSPKQWQSEALTMCVNEYLSYATILEETEHYDKEAYYLEKIKPIYGYTNSDFNALYANMLLRENKAYEAITYLEQCVFTNNATPEMLALLKENYIKEGGKSENFSSYLKTLKSKEAIKAHEKELLSSLVNKPIADFELKNMDGETVRLSDQKGKVVVLDFWAMWCAPCKKAMPGMQMAVTKYKDDPNVEFYFIDTQEYIKDYEEKVKAFIQDKNYTFNVLFDGLNEETQKHDKTYNSYAKAFQFSGIPQKMIIGPDGNLRWRSTGYYGSPSKLADEISIIIEHLKSE